MCGVFGGGCLYALLSAKHLLASCSFLYVMVQDEEKGWAVLGVALPLIGYIVLLLAKKGGAYAQYYAKQGLVLFFAWLVVWVAGMIFGMVGLGFIVWIVNILWIVLWVLGIVYALSGKKQPIPVIGEFASKF